jgi:hypothetical protein
MAGRRPHSIASLRRPDCRCWCNRGKKRTPCWPSRRRVRRSTRRADKHFVPDRPWRSGCTSHPRTDRRSLHFHHPCRRSIHHPCHLFRPHHSHHRHRCRHRSLPLRRSSFHRSPPCTSRKRAATTHCLLDSASRHDLVVRSVATDVHVVALAERHFIADVVRTAIRPAFGTARLGLVGVDGSARTSIRVFHAAPAVALALTRNRVRIIRGLATVGIARKHVAALGNAFLRAVRMVGVADAGAARAQSGAVPIRGGSSCTSTAGTSTTRAGTVGNGTAISPSRRTCETHRHRNQPHQPGHASILGARTRPVQWLTTCRRWFSACHAVIGAPRAR